MVSPWTGADLRRARRAPSPVVEGRVRRGRRVGIAENESVRRQGIDVNGAVESRALVPHMGPTTRSSARMSKSRASCGELEQDQRGVDLVHESKWIDGSPTLRFPWPIDLVLYKNTSLSAQIWSAAEGPLGPTRPGIRYT